MYSTNASGIVLDKRITSKIGTSSLGQSVGALTPADFWPVYV